VSESTVADLLGVCLRAAGVTRAFRSGGSELPEPAGVEVIDVGPPELAVLLADADGRLAGAPAPRPGLALLPGRRLRLSSSPGEEVLAHPVLDAEVLPSAIAGWTLDAVHAALELDLDLDLDALAPRGLEPLALDASAVPLVRLSPSMADLSILLVVGPGVVRAGQIDGVAEAARRTGARVVATAGALGVLPLDDPAWRGVVGLQAGDRRLAGLDDADLVIVSGIDPAEATDVLPSDAQVLEVEPWHLGLMAHTWAETSAASRATSVEGRALVEAIADLARAGRSSDALPLNPVRALADLVDVLDPAVLLLGDPGPAGLWLSRGLLGRPVGATVVPGHPVRGFAAAGALVAGLDHRSAVAVVTAPSDPATDAVLDLAAHLGVDLTCAVWGGDASWTSASEHRERLVGARHEGGVQRIAVPVDLAVTADLVDLAGRVIAWGAGASDDVPDPS
jgi:hypothetical protein